MLSAFHDGLDAFELDVRIEAAEEHAITPTGKDEAQVGKTQFLLHISVFEFDDIVVLLGPVALNQFSLDGTASGPLAHTVGQVLERIAATSLGQIGTALFCQIEYYVRSNLNRLFVPQFIGKSLDQGSRDAGLDLAAQQLQHVIDLVYSRFSFAIYLQPALRVSV